VILLSLMMFPKKLLVSNPSISCISERIVVCHHFAAVLLGGPLLSPTVFDAKIFVSIRILGASAWVFFGFVRWGGLDEKRDYGSNISIIQ